MKKNPTVLYMIADEQPNNGEGDHTIVDHYLGIYLTEKEADTVCDNYNEDERIMPGFSGEKGKYFVVPVAVGKIGWPFGHNKMVKYVEEKLRPTGNGVTFYAHSGLRGGKW